MTRRISVVVIPIAGGTSTQLCVDSLRSENPEELLVVPRSGDSSADGAKTVYCQSDFVPLRRVTGARAATGDWLAFVEDTTRVPAGWYGAARAACEAKDAGLLSGPVRLDKTLPPRQLALGIVEYGLHAHNSGVRPGVPGNAFIVRRYLTDHAGSSQGIYEQDILRQLESHGYRHYKDNSLGVLWCGGDTRNASLAARSNHGRLFAARRAAPMGSARRWFFRATCPALLVLLPARGMIWTARLNQWRALPAVLGMQFFWALGEIAGYWAGAGSAERAWC